jgi:hypothetical protein
MLVTLALLKYRDTEATEGMKALSPNPGYSRSLRVLRGLCDFVFSTADDTMAMTVATRSEVHLVSPLSRSSRRGAARGRPRDLPMLIRMPVAKSEMTWLDRP